MKYQMSNNISVSYFLLLEFSEVRELQILHFAFFLMLYLAIVSGNLLIMAAVALDHHLHTAMYFFLMNLAMQDIGSVSVFMPKSMANSLVNNGHISYPGCVAQVFFWIFFSSSDFFLLTVMAYDRYIAICNPLQYQMVMNREAYIHMVITVWIFGLLYAVIHTSNTFASPFCSNVVNQFFCEIPQLLKIACSELQIIQIAVVLLGIIVGVACFVFIAITYVQIFMTVLQIPSVQGRQKAFSTCLPHLVVFSTLMFTGCIAYLRPPSNSSSHLDVAFTVIYSMVPPMLNPVIYSMRNKEIKTAISKLLGFKYSSMRNIS